MTPGRTTQGWTSTDHHQFYELVIKGNRTNLTAGWKMILQEIQIREGRQ